MALAHRHARLRDAAAGSCPYRSMARMRCGRVRQALRVSAGSALASPAPSSAPSASASHPSPQREELLVASAFSPPPAMQDILVAPTWDLIRDLFQSHKDGLRPEDVAVTWVRLAKVNKDPAVRLSPDLQKFVDIMACATIDRLQQFTPSNMCSIIWAASKLKKGTGHSGMFKSFLKAWSNEMEVYLENLELEQVRKVLAAITRVNFTPSAPWMMKMETVLSARLASCTCPKTLACCLVSAASLGFALHPAPALREAVAAACASSFAKSFPAAGSGASAVSTSVRGEEVLVDAAATSPTKRVNGPRDAARCACSTLWAAAVLGVPLRGATVQMMLGHVTLVGVAGLASPSPSSSTSSWASYESLSSTFDAACSSEPGLGLTALDFAQVFWALSKVSYTPSEAETLALLASTAVVLPSAPPVLLATILWALADLQVVPPNDWLQRAYSSFERQLDGTSAEPLQALLHAAASLQLPAPEWSGRLMERLQDVDLRVLPDGNIVDLVMSMHALRMHPPQQLAVTLQQECVKRLSERGTAPGLAADACDMSSDGGGGGAASQAAATATGQASS